jgi:hypothetical protein
MGIYLIYYTKVKILKVDEVFSCLLHDPVAASPPPPAGTFVPDRMSIYS